MSLISAMFYNSRRRLALYGNKKRLGFIFVWCYGLNAYSCTVVVY